MERAKSVLEYTSMFIMFFQRKLYHPSSFWNMLPETCGRPEIHVSFRLTLISCFLHCMAGWGESLGTTDSQGPMLFSYMSFVISASGTWWRIEGKGEETVRAFVSMQRGATCASALSLWLWIFLGFGCWASELHKSRCRLALHGVWIGGGFLSQVSLCLPLSNLFEMDAKCQFFPSSVTLLTQSAHMKRTD